MTPDDIAQLKEGGEVYFPKTYSGARMRGRVTQVTDNFVRVDWVDLWHSYDILRRTSPLWTVIEREPKP